MHGPGCQTVQAEGDGCRYKENDYAAIILRMMHGDNVEDDGNFGVNLYYVRLSMIPDRPQCSEESLSNKKIAIDRSSVLNIFSS